MRYWFGRMALETLHARLGRPLSVLEVGIGDGKMFRFLGGPKLAHCRHGLPPWIDRWDGLDVQVASSTLSCCSYSDYIEADVECAFDLRHRCYDAVVLLHVLEHLFEPETAMRRLLDALHDDGALIGGSPTMPAPLAHVHEQWLRRKYKAVLNDVRAHRHLSVISPARIRRFAHDNSLATDLLVGTFFCRWSNLFLENFAWWPRANLLWGAAFPALGGEVYFALRKTRRRW